MQDACQLPTLTREIDGSSHSYWKLAGLVSRIPAFAASAGAVRSKERCQIGPVKGQGLFILDARSLRSWPAVGTPLEPSRLRLSSLRFASEGKSRLTKLGFDGTGQMFKCYTTSRDKVEPVGLVLGWSNRYLARGPSMPDVEDRSLHGFVEGSLPNSGTWLGPVPLSKLKRR